MSPHDAMIIGGIVYSLGLLCSLSWNFNGESDSNYLSERVAYRKLSLSERMNSLSDEEFLNGIINFLLCFVWPLWIGYTFSIAMGKALRTAGGRTTQIAKRKLFRNYLPKEVNPRGALSEVNPS